MIAGGAPADNHSHTTAGIGEQVTPMLDLMLRDKNGDLLLWPYPAGAAHAVFPWMWALCGIDVAPSAELLPMPERKIACGACLAEIERLRRAERDAALLRAIGLKA